MLLTKIDYKGNIIKKDEKFCYKNWYETRKELKELRRIKIFCFTHHNDNNWAIEDKKYIKKTKIDKKANICKLKTKKLIV